MTTIHDLGEVTATTVEWGLRRHLFDGRVLHSVRGMAEADAQRKIEAFNDLIADETEQRLRQFNVAKSVDLVTRTVTLFADGSTLYGPWTVTE